MPRTESFGVSGNEFARRREGVAASAKARGFDGLLIVSRGGGCLDRYGDVLYLTNHYSSFPYIPDLSGAWSGRAHSFLLMPIGGDPVLIVDIPMVDSVAMPQERIVVADLVVEELVEAMRRLLPEGRIGIVGADTLPLSVAKALEAALPQVRLEPADDILAEARTIKSPLEIEKLREASRLGSRMLEAMMEAADPGATHGDVVAAGMQVLIPAGGMLYNSFMASGRGGEDPTTVRSSFPTWGATTPLQPGDWFRIGISGVLDGYCFDLSRSKAIGPAVAPQIDAFEAAIEVVETAIAAMRPGVTADKIARIGAETQERLGYPGRGVFAGLGHGIGLGWDKPWLVPGDQTQLRPGMVLCVEKTLTRDGYLGDFEETVLVTEQGTVKLTDAQMRFW